MPNGIYHWLCYALLLYPSDISLPIIQSIRRNGISELIINQWQGRTWLAVFRLITHYPLEFYLQKTPPVLSLDYSCSLFAFSIKSCFHIYLSSSFRLNFVRWRCFLTFLSYPSVQLSWLIKKYKWSYRQSNELIVSSRELMSSFYLIKDWPYLIN